MTQGQLKDARHWLNQAVKKIPTNVDNLAESIHYLLAHLESVAPEVQPVAQPHRHQFYQEGEHLRTTSLPIPEPREETPQSETPSSVATETVTATPRTLPISWMWSSPAKADGTLPQTLLQATSDWLSSVRLAGNPQEVGILLTLTSRDSTPPDGSASPSTEGQVPAASGHAGEVECALETELKTLRAKAELNLELGEKELYAIWHAALSDTFEAFRDEWRKLNARKLEDALSPSQQAKEDKGR
jgi:hypothetical protein